MNLDFFEKLSNSIEKTVVDKKDRQENITEQEMELAQKLNAIEEYTVDRFEGNVAVLEDRNTGKIINEDINRLPKEIKEGTIVSKINGKYFVDEKLNKDIENRISKKMDDLWNN